MRLPLFINQKNKYPAGAIMYTLSYFAYFFTNHHPIFEPKLLPMTWLDLQVPFIPESVLIYISEYIYFAVVYIGLRNHHVINKYLYAFFTLQITSCAIFLFFPTTYPRENYPIPSDLPLWLQATWDWLRSQDAATNCFPSLHVSSVYLSAFVFLADKKIRTFSVMIVWGTLIALSTLPTKQHYFVDIVSGLAFAFLSYYWFYHKQEYQDASTKTSLNWNKNDAPGIKK